jgi:pimeloyl-ACP methyl ester carboxylesterase
MDRFCSILADAGFAVLAPFLPDYTALRVAPGCFRDLERAFEVLWRRPELPRGARPGVFSISFGSLPALWLAGHPPTRDRIGGLLVFGGYARWTETIRFCLTGQLDGAAPGPRDPLNQPVVFMNLIDELDGAPPNPAPLLATWRRYVEATWGRDEMKRGDAHVEVARRMATELPASMRELFLIGCGAVPGGVELANAALARSRERTGFLDPARHTAGIRCPVHLVHGVDDDVIPYQQSALAELLPAEARPQVHLTGLYGHTSRAGSGRGPAALARELATMGRILRAFVAAGRATDPAESR